MRFTVARLGKSTCESLTKKIPKHFVQFSNGNIYPQLGLGTFKSDPKKVTQAVKDAIDIGYRHIDCAHVYQNEKEVGLGIKAKIDEGVIKREDIYVTSKLWNTFHRVDLVRPALMTTLENLCLDYLDLYLVHWPMAYKEEGKLFPTPNPNSPKLLHSDVDYLCTWKEMEKAYHEGLCVNIGVSNFNSKQLQRLIDNCEVKPVNNQIEVHPYLNQQCLRSFCHCHKIITTSYSPLGSPDRPWAKAEDKKVLDDEWLQKRAKELKKTPALLSLRWNFQSGNIIIPMSMIKEQIAENFKVLDFELNAADMEHFNKMDQGYRLYSLTEIHGHKDHPFEKDAF